MDIPYCENRGNALSVIVDIPYAADVFLVDRLNFQNYQQGLDFKYYGGHYSQSPVKITVTNPGTYYLIVNDGGSGAQYHYRWQQN